MKQFIQGKTAQSLSPHTLRYYREKLAFLCNHCNHFGLSILGLTRQDIGDVLTRLQCNPGGKHAYLRAWRSFYSWAEENRLVEANPCSKVKIRVPKPLRHSVSKADIPTLMNACGNLRDKLIVSMFADTGLRLTELSTVSPADLDLPTQTLKVWGKGAKQRVVRYGPQTAGLLGRYLARHAPRETLFGLKPRGVSIMLSRLGKATGVRCNAHAFRRTFATESVRNGLNLFYVRSLLGHADLTMTRIYAEQVGSEDAVKAYRPIVT